MLLPYAKVRDVKSPSRGHSTDAGIDFFVPEFNTKFLDDLIKTNAINIHTKFLDDGRIVLERNCGVLIPSGIVVEIDYGTTGLFVNKSGVASKKHLLVGAQVVDTFYSGEVHIDLHNVGDEIITLSPGDKVIQMLIVPILVPTPTEVKIEEIYKNMKLTSFRDAGGFGSPGLK
jgi:dUTP pyrophosphatase